MTSFSNAGDPASQSRQWRGCGGMRWKPLEIAAVVIGFAVYWPIGLAILGIKIAQRRGYTVDDAVASARRSFSWFGGSKSDAQQWRPFNTGVSGNAAFDDWRKAELAKLDEERRKLDAAQQEFAEHLANLRRARDQEEFERFMAARTANRPSN